MGMGMGMMGPMMGMLGGAGGGGGQQAMQAPPVQMPQPAIPTPQNFKPQIAPLMQELQGAQQLTQPKTPLMSGFPMIGFNN